MVLEEAQVVAKCLQCATRVDCRFEFSDLFVMILSTVLQAHTLEKHIEMKRYPRPLSKLVPVLLPLIVPVNYCRHSLIHFSDLASYVPHKVSKHYREY